MSNYEKTVEDLTLLLLYLQRFEEKNEFTNKPIARSWKGYNFSVLNDLEAKELIFQGNHPSRVKSVYLEDKGIERALELMKEYNIKLED